MAQTPRRVAPSKPAAHPDISGLWQSLGSPDVDLRDHVAQAGPYTPLGALGATPAGVTIIDGGLIPYLPAAAQKQKENYANRLKLDPAIKCYMPGIPRAHYMPFPFQIVQSDDVILFAYEFATANRVVNMKNHKEAPVDSWMGWSNGHWEGQTLVVDVTGLNGMSWLDRAGNFASETAHIVERFTPQGPNHLLYEATITDPAVYSLPWKISLPLYRRMEKNAQLLEFKCVEYAEENLYGDLKRK